MRFRSRNRFSPSVSTLEGRQLLSLSLVGGAPTFNLVAGQGGSLALGVVSYTKPGMIVTVDYGDGSGVTNATYAVDPKVANEYDISSAHNYRTAGTYHISIDAYDLVGGDLSWTDTATVVTAGGSTTPPPPPPPISTAGFPSAKVVESNANENIVGAPFKFEVDPISPGFAPYTISKVTWSIPGGLADQTLNNLGFHTTSIASAIATGSANEGVDMLGDWWITGYWNGMTGVHTVQASVDFVNMQGQHYFQNLSLDVAIFAPKVTVQATAGPVTLSRFSILNGGTWRLTAGDSVGNPPGMKLTATIDPSSVGPIGGTYGWVQTINKLDAYEYAQADSPTGPVPFTMRGFIDNPALRGGVAYQTLPLLDTLTVFAKSPYYGAKAPIATVGTGNAPAVMTDSPQSQFSLIPKDGVTVTRVTRSDSFTDWLIFTPNGGVPVVIGSTTWAWGATAVTDPLTGLATLMPGSVQNPVVTAAYAPSPTLPTWADTSLRYLGDQGYVSYYKVS